jgi:iron complex outermembrane receptor protein
LRSLRFITALLILPLSPSYGQTAAVEGVVVSAETGEALPGVNVAARADGNVAGGGATDVGGAFRVEGLAAGEYVVRATAVGYTPATERVRLENGQTRSIRFRLEQQAQELNEIVVRSTRSQEATPTTVQRLSTAEIVRQDPATVADVARLLPAAHVATNSRGQTILYFRGSADRQTGQFFNGALLNIPWDDRVDLGVLPASMLNDVTASKGVPSVRYGTNVPGGAVNFTARSLRQPGFHTEMRASAGTPAAGSGSVLHMGRQGNWSYTAEAGVTARSDYALPDGTDLPFSQPSGETRTNTDRRVANAFLHGEYRFDGGARLSASLLHVDSEKGAAPESNLNPAVTGVRFWRYPTWRKSMLVVNGEMPLGPAGGPRLRGAVWGSRFAQDIHQHESVDYDRLQEVQNDLDYTAGARLIGIVPAGPGALDLTVNTLTTRHRQNNVLYEEGDPTPDSVSVYRQHLFSVGAEYDWPLTERLGMTAGASFDGTATPQTGPFPARDPIYGYSITTGLTYAWSEQLSFHAAAGRKPRFPTPRELFGAALGKFVPNPGLRPVSALKAEAGASWRGAALSAEVTAFFNRTYDTIDKRTLQSGPNEGKEQRVNLEGTRVYGIETRAAARPTDRLALDGHLTWMRPRGFVNGEARPLDEKPAWIGLLTATYDLPFGLRAMAQSEYLGGVYARTEANTFTRLPDALIFDARLSYSFSPAALGLADGEVFARVDNLTDELRLLQLGLPGPGREFRVGFKLTL